MSDALRESVARMARIGFCRSPTFAPDAGRIAFVSDLGGLPQVWAVDAGGGWPDAVTSLEDPVLLVRWSPDGAHLAFMAAPGGGMNAQVFLVRPDGAALQRVTEGGRSNNWLHGWSEDARHVLYSSNARDPASMDACLLDAATGETHVLGERPGINMPIDVSSDGKRALVYRQLQRGDNDLYLFELETGREVLLTPHEGPGTFDAGAFSDDGRRVFLASNAGRELKAFGVVELDGSAPSPIRVLAERDDAELEHFVVARNRSIALLAWNAAGRSELDVVDLGSLSREPCHELPGDVVQGGEISADGRFVALAVGGAARPFDVWLYDRGKQALRQLTRSPHAGVELDELARPELVRFTAHDRLELTGWLYRTPGSRPGPVVISYHGGPEAQERPRLDPTYHALVEAGIAVFAPNVRGSAGFGTTFVNLDNGPLRVNAVKDIRSCVEFLVSSGVAEPGRIGVMGGSYGGYMTMAALTHYPDLFAAGADICGIVNFETFFANTEPWMREISNVGYGDRDGDPELLLDLSPIHRIDRARAPTLVLHGENDTNVPVIEAEQVVEALRTRDVPVEYLLFQGEGHGFAKRENRVEATVAIVRWFVRHLAASAEA